MVRAREGGLARGIHGKGANALNKVVSSLFLVITPIYSGLFMNYSGFQVCEITSRVR